MALYAEVAVEAARSLGREAYTYAVPTAVDVVPGHRVWIPFGPRGSYGYVLEVHSRTPDRAVKDIERADAEPLLQPHHLHLARLVAYHYWAPLIECLRAFLPPRVRLGRSSGAGPSSRQTRHSRLLQVALPSGPPEEGPELSWEQAAAVQASRESRAVLLHGVTASGKTEVYLRAAEEAMGHGLRVLLLVPEISLSPQLLTRVVGRLGRPAAVLHSQLTDLERAQQWWRIRRGEVDLVIGSRSAIFAPIARLGLICLDEEGSSAYKQDRTPRYEASWVARRLAEITAARLILGSATPSLEAYAEAQSGRLRLAELRRRVVGRPAQVELVDMRREARYGNRLPISRRLATVLEQSLVQGEQAILFLNRRGAATFVLCQDCGESVSCPGCSVAMVEHQELAALSCHYCGYSRPVPEYCQNCGSRQIRGLGVGTQRLEGMVKKLWPEKRVLRLDRDSSRGPDGYLDVLEAFSEGRADVLVGTQLVARGLDLETVTAVGVIDADLPLHFPDYRSAEATFALLSQVAGRAGRGTRSATVVVQTSNPDHYSLRRAAEGDYAGFAAAELPSRQRFQFPPFGELAVLTYSHRDDDQAAAVTRDAAEALAAALVKEHLAGIRVQGPAPAFLHQLRGQYRWQVTLKGEELSRIRPLLPGGRGWSFDVDPA
ncbi:MAG: primosomal protein N' [Candidatus Dormibacteraeota bacterium]|uniref:Replication restart protein PriA n=1 Tax=Candidatus Dormiibacter inghamiae TaxID=3127013 RepID=A0A934NHW2_9BACT|nr:primosomal protein N' [Candidatus Dormibacteraeota bacterium]MBJ7605828.1 primosomal protein N' [Candidatus Dormibacteraeota bacterium]